VFNLVDETVAEKPKSVAHTEKLPLSERRISKLKSSQNLLLKRTSTMGLPIVADALRKKEWLNDPIERRVEKNKQRRKS
jgi:hypothetical protein